MRDRAHSLPRTVARMYSARKSVRVRMMRGARHRASHGRHGPFCFVIDRLWLLR